MNICKYIFLHEAKEKYGIELAVCLFVRLFVFFLAERKDAATKLKTLQLIQKMHKCIRQNKRHAKYNSSTILSLKYNRSSRMIQIK